VEGIAAAPMRPGDARWLYALAEWFAMIGGAIFVAIAALSAVSIASRALFSAPLSGDYELVQAGTAIFVALCLPLCQLRYANIIIDFFTTRTSERTQRMLDALGALLLGLVMALCAWRLAVGTISMRESNETSAILGWPIWYTYAAMVPGIALTAIAGFYVALLRWREAVRAGPA